MRAVMVNVPDSLLAERRRTGADLFDEMWEGMLHMVPAPSAAHQWLNAKLMMVLGPLAETRGLVPRYAAGGVDEVLVVDPKSRRAEVFARRGSRMVLVESDPGRLESLGVDLATVDGPKLRLTWDGGAAEV